MASSAQTTQHHGPEARREPQRWIYGPAPDLLLGCAGIWLLMIPLLLVPMVNGWVSARATVLAGAIALFINTPHYGATLLRVYQHRQDRQKYALFAVWISIALLVLFTVATRSPWLGSWLVTLYVTWSPWHFAGQNYGLASMFLRRRGVQPEPLAKRLLYASFLLSFGLAFFTIHGENPGLSVAPVPPMSNAIYEQLSFGIPASVTSPAALALALAYVGTVVASVALLLRQGSLADLGPALLLVLMQAAWFSVPAVLRFTGAASADHLVLSTLWIAGAHSLQYLWVTSYYAKKTDDPQWLAQYLTKTMLAGAALLVLPGLVFAPQALGVVPYDSGLAILLFSVMNIHHFMLDGAVWKLRDGRVARALLRSVPAGPQIPDLSKGHVPSAPGPLRRAAVAGAWGSGLAALAIGIFGLYEIEVGTRALRSGDYERAIRSAERMGSIGRANENVHRLIAYSLWKNGASPSLVLEHYQRSLEIRPTAATWAGIGYFHLDPRPGGARRGAHAQPSDAGSRNPEAALAAFRNALGLDGRLLSVWVESGKLLAERGDFAGARDALRRARSLAPRNPEVVEFARQLSTLEISAADD